MASRGVSVLESAKFIAEHARHVSISPEGVKAAAAKARKARKTAHCRTLVLALVPFHFFHSEHLSYVNY